MEGEYLARAGGNDPQPQKQNEADPICLVQTQGTWVGGAAPFTFAVGQNIECDT